MRRSQWMVGRSVVALLAGGISLFAQVAESAKDQVLKMSKAGFADEVIVAKVKSDGLASKVAIADLLSLKEAGVSDAVLKALAESGATVSSDPDDPLAPHDPGVYLLTTTREGKRKLVAIDRAGSNRARTANVWGAAFSYGISKAKVKSELPGRRAPTRVNELRPQFYMYFPSSGTLGAADTISSPAQFTLVQLEVKKDNRDTVIGKWGLGSASAGADDKRTVKFTSEKIRPYIYRVSPSTDLTGEEYAFIATSHLGGASAAPTVVIFDFGMDR